MEEEVEFLGQWITPQGAAPLKQKMRAVVEWEAPQDLKGVRSFLGFANYYRRFVQGYAELASPLTYLTKKDVPWVWGPPQRHAFQRLKQALCNAPLLQYPDPSKPYVVVTNASSLAGWGCSDATPGPGSSPLSIYESSSETYRTMVLGL